MSGNVAFDARIVTRVATVLALVIGTWISGLTAQAPPAVAVRDEASFAEAMVRTDEAWAIVSEATEGPSFLLNSVRGDGLTRLDRMRDNLTGVRGFFLSRSRPDAVELADRALLAVAALRVELARAEPDQAAALELVEPVRAACAACHLAYREGDADRGFRFKSGVVD